MSYFAYMVKCSDGTIYSGYARDVEGRVRAHNCGSGAKYTRSRTPVELAFYQEFGTKGEAMKKEAELKKLSRVEKLALIEIFALNSADC